jgi:hypothetical protein
MLFFYPDSREGEQENSRTDHMKPTVSSLELGRHFRRAWISFFAAVVLSTGQIFAAPLHATYVTGAEVPITANGFDASGKELNISLNFMPRPGTELTLVRNTGAKMINGTFANIAQGATISLAYAGLTFKFVANYHGGQGKDLVLLWTNDGNLSPAVLTKLDPQLLLALKQIRGIAPFDKPTSLRPNVPIQDGDRVLVNVAGSISQDLADAIAAAGGQVIDGFATNKSARVLVPVSQLETLAARTDVISISTTKLSVKSKVIP